jgi:hypothetical protein
MIELMCLIAIIPGGTLLAVWLNSLDRWLKAKIRTLAKNSS